MSDENQPVIIAEGDSVWLKSGGPEMKVEAIDGETVLTSWQDVDGQEQSHEFDVATLTKEPTSLKAADNADEQENDSAGAGADGLDSGDGTDSSGAGASQPQEVDTAAIQDGVAEATTAEPAVQGEATEEPAEAPAQEPVVGVDPAAGSSETIITDIGDGVIVGANREYKGPEDANLDPQVQPEGADAGLGQAGESAEEAEEKPEVDASAPAETQEDFSSDASETNLAEQFAAAQASGSSLRDELKGVLPEDALAAWSDEALLLYKEKGVWVEKTLRGNWVIDIRRTRALGEWPATALQDWLDGGVATPKGVDEDLIWEEVYKRFKVPGNFTHEAAKAYVINGVTPELTKSGLLKQDATRALKSILHWTYAELRGALLGEFEHDHSQDDLLVQLRRRLGLNDTYAGDRLLAGLEEASQEANVNDTLLKSTLQEYAALMTKYGANLTETAAGAGQRMLNNAIRNVMKRDYIGFHEGWNIILDFVNTNYNALFTPDKARRGWGQTGLTGQQLAIYENLLTLIIATRAPVGRKQNAEMFNFDTILRYVAKEQERTNIVTYYGSLGQ